MSRVNEPKAPKKPAENAMKTAKDAYEAEVDPYKDLMDK
jgi:hypothetical protein